MFAALTMALDPVRVPSVILFGVYFRFCEIPIVAASLLFGLRIAVPVAILNVAVEIMLFPNPVAAIGVPFVLILTLNMLLGLHLALEFLKRKDLQTVNRDTTQAKYFLIFGTSLRTAIAPFLLVFVYRFISPIVGIHLSDVLIVSLMPAFTLYALIFSLYTISIGYIIARTISRNLKVGNQL